MRGISREDFFLQIKCKYGKMDDYKREIANVRIDKIHFVPGTLFRIENFDVR